MSRVRRRKRNRQNLVLLTILVILTIAVLFAGLRCLLFQELEQTQDIPAAPPTETGQASEEADAAAEALRSHQERKPNFYTILVSGVDDGNGLSDTNILVAVDVENSAIYGVSIPRDTKAVWNGKSHKLNAAYGSGGMERLSAVVSEQLGIPVDYTVLVDLDGFVALVDAIGGVDFEVPINMDYEDPYQDLYIHISKGMQHLSGSEAIKVVRFREGYATQDIGRTQTQQAFLKAVAKQTLKVSNLTKVNELVKIFQKYVETDLSIGNLAWLANQAISIGADNIEFSTLPGEWNDKDGYIYVDQEAALSLVNAHLNPYVEDRVSGDMNLPS